VLAFGTLGTAKLLYFHVGLGGTDGRLLLTDTQRSSRIDLDAARRPLITFNHLRTNGSLRELPCLPGRIVQSFFRSKGKRPVRNSV
jgi:hypothetical protein